MSAIHQLFKKYNLEQGMSVTRAISAVGQEFATHSDPAAGPNKLIALFGGKPVKNSVEADIIAKALVEQAVVLGDDFDTAAAFEVAAGKVAKIRTSMPYAFAGTDQAVAPVKAAKRAGSRGGDKKVRARTIFDREQGKSAGAVAKIIATELDITYANAYYYVSRVFNK